MAMKGPRYAHAEAILCEAQLIPDPIIAPSEKVKSKKLIIEARRFFGAISPMKSDVPIDVKPKVMPIKILATRRTEMFGAASCMTPPIVPATPSADIPARRPNRLVISPATTDAKTAAPSVTILSANCQSAVMA